jgi:HTH-type transcriptional regulator / antitoxin HipB
MDVRTPRDIGGLIRARRRALGLDQRTLASRVGVSRLWLGEVERGKPGASLALVLRTLAALGVTLSAPEQPSESGTVTGDFAPVQSADINAIVAAARRR